MFQSQLYKYCQKVFTTFIQFLEKGVGNTYSNVKLSSNNDFRFKPPSNPIK